MWTTLKVFIEFVRASPMAQHVKNLPAMQETQEMRVQSLGWEDSLEKEMATYSSVLAWEIPWSLAAYSPWSHKESDKTEMTEHIEFITILFLFYVLAFLPWGMWYLSPPVRDWTCTPSLEAQSLNHWSAREVLAKQSCWRWPRGMPSKKGR